MNGKRDQRDQGRTRWTTTTTGMILVLGVAMAMLAFAPTTLAQGSCDATVTDGDSIQTAIGAASAGDTVCVDEGTFDETVTVDKTLTLLGNNSGVPGDGARGGESTLKGQFVLEADGITLDGFDVTPAPATQTSESVAILVTADDVVVTNNIVRDFSEDGLTDWVGVEGIQAYGGDETDAVSNVEITNNFIHGIESQDDTGGAAGVMIIGNVDGATVQNNAIQEIGLEQSAWAQAVVVTDTGAHAEVPANVDVSSNTISDILAISSTPWYGVGVGIETAGEDYQLTGNQISNIGLGVEIKDAATMEILDSSIQNADIGLLVTGAVDLQVLNTVIQSSGTGVLVQADADIAINQGVISHNGEGLVNEASATVDATENYWGAAMGPEADDNQLPLTGSSVQGDVDYRPWCVDADCTATTDGGATEAVVFDTILEVEGHGECHAEGFGGGADDGGASVTSDLSNPVQASTPGMFELSGALWACANALAGLGFPDGGSHVALTADVLDGSIQIDASSVPLSDRATEQDDPEATTSASAEGQCVYDDRTRQDEGSVAVLDDDPIAADVPEVDGQTTGGIFWHAVFDCFLPAILDGSTLDGGSYLAANVNVADGTVTADYSTVPQSDALTEASGGQV